MATSIKEPTKRPGRADGPRQRKRQQRIKELCDAGRALFVERGVAAVTIDEIVDAAGVAKGSFYRYFHNKETLVEAVIDPLRSTALEATSRCAEAIATATSPDQLAPQYLIMARSIAAVVVAHPQVLLLYLQESRAPAVGATRPVRELADELTRRAIALSTIARQHGLTTVEDSRVSALAVLGAIEKLLFAHLSGVDIGPAEEVPRKLIAIILDGVRAGK